MNKTDTPQFIAVVSLSLPDMAQAVTARVTLTPKDAVPVGAAVKPLPECTLADLQQYANELEAEVWQTYQQIRLAELAAGETVAVKLDVMDGDGDFIPTDRDWDWEAQVVLTATADEGEDTDTAVEETEPVEEFADTAAPGAETDLDNIIVAEPQPVHEEREAPEEGAEETETVIAPSRARVRVAGEKQPIGAPAWSAVDILIDEPALRAAQAHALSSLNREVAGVLIGERPEKQPDGRYVVHIFDTLIAKYTVMNGASVTYTPESWRYMNDRLREKYPDDTAVIVGWYHTHPGFGIFLSGMDLFIHQNFFTQIWHVAYVLDPRARTSGFFTWDREKSHVSRYDFPWPSWAAGSW
ncbi:MAG TPA: hypothetical protein ENK32_10370 [Anaerolineae bacterium]|nr:hypothetical protein [Anaerolineae bacterium]